MKKTKKELIELNFYSITEAAEELGITRRTIYKFMKSNRLTTRVKNMIIKSGYCPKTFKPVAHTKSQ